MGYTCHSNYVEVRGQLVRKIEVLSLQPVRSHHWIQIVSLDNKCFHPLSHLASPGFIFQLPQQPCELATLLSLGYRWGRWGLEKLSAQCCHCHITVKWQEQDPAQAEHPTSCYTGGKEAANSFSREVNSFLIYSDHQPTGWGCPHTIEGTVPYSKSKYQSHPTHSNKNNQSNAWTHLFNGTLSHLHIKFNCLLVLKRGSQEYL